MSRFADDWMEKSAEEMKKQSKMLKEIEGNLKGFGVKVVEENVKKNKLQCTFKSTVTATIDTYSVCFQNDYDPASFSSSFPC